MIFQDDDFEFLNSICNFVLLILQLQSLTDTTEEYQVWFLIKNFMSLTKF